METLSIYTKVLTLPSFLFPPPQGGSRNQAGVSWGSSLSENVLSSSR